MSRSRGALDVDTLLKVILVLVAVWLALEIVGEVVQITLGLLGPLRPLLGIAIIVLIVLWLFDRI